MKKNDKDSEISRIKKNIEESHRYFHRNIENYHTFRKIVFETAITDDMSAKLEELKKPKLEFNVLEAYISRLRGEFSKQVPSLQVRALNDEVSAATVEVIQAHIRNILQDANNNQMENEVWKDTLSGGYSILKVWTEYENEKSFQQNIRIGRVYDPTLAGFDPLARYAHKGDAQYAYELFPKTKEDFEKDYPHVELQTVDLSNGIGSFKWSFHNQEKEVILLANYYEKVQRKIKIHYLSNKETVTDKEYKKLLVTWEEEGRIEQPPSIVKTRESEEVFIMRYLFAGDTLIQPPDELDFKYLPLIFVDGNSVLLKDEVNSPATQFTRPYIYHAIGQQQLKNFLGQTFAAEIQNMEMHKWMIDKDAIPQDHLQEWLNPQIPGSLIFQSRNEEGDPLPPPTAIPRVPIPNEILAGFMEADKTIQNILGSYDASLGINNNQLSGVAIQEGATQSNATAMPYVMNFMAALNQAAQIILDLIPKYYVTPRTIPVTKEDGSKSFIQINKPIEIRGGGQAPKINMKYSSNALEVKVEAGPSFKIEKNRAMETMATLSKAFPAFQEMINQKGLPILMSNLDIKGADQLKKLAEEFQNEQIQRAQMQQRRMQGTLPPEVLAQEDLKIKASKVEVDNKKAQTDRAYKFGQLKLDADKLHNERVQSLINDGHATKDNQLKEARLQTEAFNANAKLTETLLKSERTHHEDERYE